MESKIGKLDKLIQVLICFAIVMHFLLDEEVKCKLEHMHISIPLSVLILVNVFFVFFMYRQMKHKFVVSAIISLWYIIIFVLYIM